MVTDAAKNYYLLQKSVHHLIAVISVVLSFYFSSLFSHTIPLPYHSKLLLVVNEIKRV